MVIKSFFGWMKTEWYHSTFMIHHPNWVGPTNEHLFGWVLSNCFHDLVTKKKMDESNEKWKQVSAVFKTQKLKLSGMSVNKMRLWAPKVNVLSHPSQALGYYHWSSFVPFQFSPKFLLKIFPLLTSLSQPLLIFTSLFIPNKLAPWHRSSWSKHWTRPKKDTAWLKNNAWSKHWTRPKSSLASLLSSVTVSIPFSPSPRCNVYLSLPLHFPCPWSSLVFLLDVKEGFWFKVLMLIVACETTFLYNLLKH